MKRLLLVLLCLVACAPQSKSQLQLSLEPSKLNVGRRTVVLVVQRDGKPFNGAAVSVEGTMTHAGMGSVLGTSTELGGGKYRLAAFDFNMAGDWVLIVTAKKGNETLTGELRLGVNP